MHQETAQKVQPTQIEFASCMRQYLIIDENILSECGNLVDLKLKFQRDFARIFYCIVTESYTFGMCNSHVDHIPIN